ncbi:CDP-2,3-bis-(O-geranylgeranyl)-sn-glycerol synthase [Candidatus Micrarchaeota archaeon]|nr:MAG: CDP-2,3-bis-(O-geranylgeranyl)-sn-glycerol synthase [Candidatus Micrarchaeota archaeon]
MDLLALLILVFPAYVANSSPVLLGGGLPVDFKKKFWDGRRILGGGKTWRGTLGGIAAGSIAGIVIGFVAINTPYTIYDCTCKYVSAGFIASCGTMFGDLFGSFIKRRSGMKPGKPYMLLDQLPFIIFALLFLLPFGLLPALTALDWLIILVATLVLHVVMNWLANRLGWKKVPW